MDVYFRFAAGGDYYLGQLLSLKDPMKADFNVPCPHWKDLADPMVIEEIKLTFGKVLLSHECTEHDPFGVLSLLLASMVHHPGWMMKMCQAHTNHPFNTIPYSSSPLILGSRECLTMDLNDHIPRVTGIPQHIQHMYQIHEVKDIMSGVREDIAGF